jgi:hypothetical protein
MNIFSKWFLGKEIKEILGAIDALAVDFTKYSSFDNVKHLAEKVILKNKEDIKRIMLRDNVSPIRAAFSWINNISGDMLESGQYHIYRGTLDLMGKELLEIFDISTDKLVEVGDMNKDRGEQHKQDIRRRIKSVG